VSNIYNQNTNMAG